jgi:hypothetical protein
VLAFDFMEKRPFEAKTNRNSVFLGLKAKILDRIYKMVPHISFYAFIKFHISAQNPKVFAFGFTEKCQFVAKTLYFLVVKPKFWIRYT